MRGGLCSRSSLTRNCGDWKFLNTSGKSLHVQFASQHFCNLQLHIASTILQFIFLRIGMCICMILEARYKTFHKEI